MCDLRPERLAKVFEQRVHLNGVSPVWVRMWTLSFSSWV